jgi:hypothetical protein
MNTNTQQKRVNMKPLILGIGFFVCLAAAFGSGMRAMKRERDALYQAKNMVSQNLRTTELTLQGREAQAHLLEVRRQLDVSLREVGQRNFGAAETHLKEAKTRLETIQQSGTVGLMDLAPVQTALGNLTTLSDTSGPTINDIIGQIDAGIEKNPVLAPDALAQVTVPPPTANDIPDQTLGNEISDKMRH